MAFIPSFIGPVQGDLTTRDAVPGTQVSRMIMSASTGRRWGAIFNNSANTLFLNLGTGASASIATTGSFTLKLTSGSYFELPNQPCYQGEVHGVWDANGGWAMVTSLNSSE